MSTVKNKKTTEKIVLKRVEGRNKLSEGRSTGVAFAYAKKEGNTYTAAHALSPCKDYLNDVLWTEKTGKDSNACGLHYKKQDIFKDDTHYLLCEIVYQSNTNTSVEPFKTNFKKDQEEFKNQFENIKVFINKIENDIELKILSEFHFDDNLLLCKFSSFWSEDTYLISLYSYLVRLGRFCPTDLDPYQFLVSIANNSFKTNGLSDRSISLISQDRSYATSALVNLLIIKNFSNNKVAMTNALSSTSAPHSHGFMQGQSQLMLSLVNKMKCK
jgi:hypothetical protein